MRTPLVLPAGCSTHGHLCAAAPPARTPPEWLALIDQLGDDDTHAAAQKKLEALGEAALPALRRAARSHDDADVRLRASVLAAAIEKKVYGEVRRFAGHAGALDQQANSVEER
jgi:hypothetical protein